MLVVFFLHMWKKENSEDTRRKSDIKVCLKESLEDDINHVK